MDRFVYAIYRLLAGAICLLPITGVFRLGWGMGTLAYYVAWPYRRLVLHNLGIAFGAQKSPEELRVLAQRHFATLGANLLSSLKLARLSREEIMQRVTVEGLETLTVGNHVSSGFVMVISHLGSWEMFAQLSPIVFGCKVGTIFQSLGNRFIDAEVRHDRARLGLELFERKQGFIEACRFMREGGAVGVLVDQHAGDAGLWCPFFDRLASTSALAATLALRTGAWLVPAAVYTAGVARWRCAILDRIEPLDHDAETLTIRINQTLEKQICEQPEDWFWVHNRWKTPKPKFLLTTYKRGLAFPLDYVPECDLQPFRILIRATNWLGDAVMSAPAVRAIRRGRVDAQVTILTPAKLADFWWAMDEVDDVITIESDESVFAVAEKIRRDFDVAILFPNSLRVGLEAWLAGIPRRVGYPGHNRRALLNQIFSPKKKKTSRPPPHQVHHYLELAEFVGADIDGALAASPRLPRAAGTAAIIGLCPGAEYGPTKRWMPERFGEVMKAIHQDSPCAWKLFGVAGDRATGDAVIEAAGIPCTDLIGKTTLAQLIAELRTCDLLLTNDTGTMHLASFLDVPTVAIFGSTEPLLTGPLGENHRIIRQHVSCSPCFLKECPLDFRCMEAVAVTEVVAAVQAALRDRTEQHLSLS